MAKPILVKGDRPRIGLALSGGGFRATAFGLGALRALHDRCVLQNIDVVSGISGGSLLTAMWAYGPEAFDEFDDSVNELLRHGLQMEMFRRALKPRRSLSIAMGAAGKSLPGRLKRDPGSTLTDALVDALASRSFGNKLMTDVTQSGLDTIISATDLSTGNAVRFGSTVSSCSPYGVIDEPVSVADAVAASAAYPVILPHLNRKYTFTRSDNSQYVRSLLMTDGGVYDNLGLTPLLPGRSKSFTSHAYDLDYIIAIDAGIGRTARRAPRLWPNRLRRSFEIAHTRSQDGSRARVHELASGKEGFGLVYAYLGMADERLPVPLPDLVERGRVTKCPTDFAKMTIEDIEGLTTRGEQLTRALLEFYCPALGLRHRPR